jgi:cytochrome c biogenesis protein
MLQFLSSLKLTLTLLIGLALVAIAGTLRPIAEGRYEIFYQSFGFRLLLAFLALNLAVCTLKTIRRNLRERERLFEILHTELSIAVPLRFVFTHGTVPTGQAAALARQGYRAFEQEGRLLARRGGFGRWGSTIVHLSVLTIMLGALLASLGFVGTVNLLVGDSTANYFDWKSESDRPLAFELRLDHFEPHYYPIDLRFVALDPVSREVVATITTREGETVSLPRPGWSAKVLRFYPYEEDLILGLYRDGVYLGEYHALGGKQTAKNTIDPGLELRPAAYRDPIVQQLRSEVSILEKGKLVKRAVIEVNQPLVHKGVTIYQTAYNRDKFGFWSAGFQVTRDPAEPLVWIGCIGLILGLLAAFAVPYRAVGITVLNGETLLVALAGFRGDAGAREFEELGRSIGSAPVGD